MVPPASDRAPPTPPYSGSRPGWRRLRVRGCHPLRPALPGAFRCLRFPLAAGPTTPAAPRRRRFGLAPFRSPLLGGSLLFSFPPTTGMFRFVGFASPSGDAAPSRGGLPHSDTHGSRAARASPWSFAACRVLPRLREPRHPPCALPRFSPRRRALAQRPARVSLSCVCFPPILSKNRPGEPPGYVENVGLEPTTPGLQSRCSSRLSQSPRRLCV